MFVPTLHSKYYYFPHCTNVHTRHQTAKLKAKWKGLQIAGWRPKARKELVQDPRSEVRAWLRSEVRVWLRAEARNRGVSCLGPSWDRVGCTASESPLRGKQGCILWKYSCTLHHLTSWLSVFTATMENRQRLTCCALRWTQRAPSHGDIP